jgi:mannose-6-phosphate isomerase
MTSTFDTDAATSLVGSDPSKTPGGHGVRPWGSWQIIDEGTGYKVKRLQVNPGARLSRQVHRFRSEHWVVVAGRATCVIAGSTSIAVAGESVDVPQGAQHRLANAGGEELIVIEVQRGTYTGEDDIVRLDDDYGRAPMVAPAPPGPALALEG